MRFSEHWSRLDFEEVRQRIMNTDEAAVRRALGMAGQRLGQREFEALLSPAAAAQVETMAVLAQRLTRQRFGRTVQLYAPLYLSNACSNICTYCGFSAGNKIRRKTLKPAEIDREAQALKALGFDHVLLVTGETAHVGPDYLEEALRRLRPRFANLSLEVQPLEAAEYLRLTKAGMSGVLVYQETYDKAAYGRHHLSGAKTDMEWRIDTPDRLGEAGVHKVGLGALYGLSDWRADTATVGLHLRHLETTYWKTKYSVSFPRLRPHAGEAFHPTPFDERDLIQAACALRLLCPEAELALSTRESVHFRHHAMKLCFTHMSAGSKTNPGGYTRPEDGKEALEQFAPHDNRSPSEVVADLRASGYDPVWKDWDPCFDSGLGAAKPLTVAGGSPKFA